MDNELEKAVAISASQKAYFSTGNSYESKAGNHCEHVVVASHQDDKSTQQLMELLTKLPALYKDVETLAEVVVSQNRTIIEQQQQIERLTSALDTVAVARIQTDIGRNLHDHLAKLAENSNMYRHGGGKVTLEVKSSFSHESSEMEEKSGISHSLEESIQKGRKEIAGGLKILSKIELSASARQDSENLLKQVSDSSHQQLSDRKQKSSIKMSGTATYEHGEILCDPTLPHVIELIRKDPSNRNLPEVISQLRANPFANVFHELPSIESKK